MAALKSQWSHLSLQRGGSHHGSEHANSVYSSLQFSTGPQMPSHESPSIVSLSYGMDIVGLDEEFEEETVKIFVQWQGMREPIEVSLYCTLMDLAGFVESAPEAIPAHKFFIFRGIQLHPSFTLEQALVCDGAVLHLVLNDDPYRGRPIYIRVKDGPDDVHIRMIMCGADFYIADVKEELAYLQVKMRARTDAECLRFCASLRLTLPGRSGPVRNAPHLRRTRTAGPTHLARIQHSEAQVCAPKRPI